MTEKVGSETAVSEAGTQSDDEVIDTRTFEKSEQDDPPEQTPEEAEASFAAGFDAIAKDKDDQVEKPEPTKPEAGTKAKGEVKGEHEAKPDKAAAEEPQPLTPEEQRSLMKRLRKTEGQLGELKSKLEKQADSGGTTKAERQEIQAQLKHLKEIEESIGEFGELAPFKDEMQAIAQQVAELQAASKGSGSLSPDDVDDRINMGILSYAHPDWEEKSKSPDFRKFALQGGPSEADYAKWARLDANPATAAQAEEMKSDWEIDYPGWWKDKAGGLFSNRAVDSIALLDKYAEAVAAASGRQQSHVSQQQKRMQRLRSSATPMGVSSDPVIGTSDDEAFQKGFKKARGR